MKFCVMCLISHHLEKFSTARVRPKQKGLDSSMHFFNNRMENLIFFRHISGTISNFNSFPFPLPPTEFWTQLPLCLHYAVSLPKDVRKTIQILSKMIQITKQAIVITWWRGENETYARWKFFVNLTKREELQRGRDLIVELFRRMLGRRCRSSG